ncbi:hypothetical protein BV22DRAFT_1051683 [Leucogyrophana mollusca]|uniref:Uncharacterized protein n=1 Tax=Leucogyrophana mollusca TaxID=85980 RepID=A0ACB8AYY4_9AGAM|nr:hypothetical protein BV22DRAFT_1051683 [Leucogyrophana mollusca]
MPDSNTTIEIDDNTTAVFDSREWIDCGKYPASDTPSYILTALAALIAIPPSYSSYLPDVNLSILDLLRAPSPTQPSVLVQERADKCFSKLEPNEDATCLETRKIPPAEWIQKIEKALGQAWFDGARSLVDWRYGKDLRLPLWAITYWKEMSIVLKKRRIWQGANQWLTQTSQSHKTPCLVESDNALEKMGDLGWGATLRRVVRGLGVETLAPLLSEQWLDDDIINLAMHHLRERVHLFPDISKSTIIAPLQFSTNLVSADSHPYAQAVALPHLRHYTSVLKSGQHTILYFPGHINNNHWVAFCVDFNRRSLRYVYVSSNSKPIKVIRAAQTWLRKEFGSPFKDEGDTLTHGVQNDQFSCGICVVNTIAHNAFGDELFTHAKQFVMRILLFVELAESEITLGSMEQLDYHSIPVWDMHLIGDCAVSFGGMDTDEHDDLPRGCLNDSEPDDTLVMQEMLESVSDDGFSQAEFSEHPASLPPDSPSSSAPDISVDTTVESMSCDRDPPTTSSAHIPAGRKRRSSSADISQSSDAPTGSITKKPKATIDDSTMFGQVGISRSAMAEQKLKAAIRDGSLKINDAKRENYEYTCQLHDWHACFRYGDEGWQVWHSKCGKWYRQKVPYDTARFVEHVVQCDAKGRVGLISDWARPMKQKQTEKQKQKQETNLEPDSEILPCLGITPEAAPLLPGYLLHTPAQGGGARAPHVVAFEVYGITYKDLNRVQKECHIPCIRAHISVPPPLSPVLQPCNTSSSPSLRFLDLHFLRNTGTKSAEGRSAQTEAKLPALLAAAKSLSGARRKAAPTKGHSGDNRDAYRYRPQQILVIPVLCALSTGQN